MTKTAERAEHAENSRKRIEIVHAHGGRIEGKGASGFRLQPEDDDPCFAFIAK
jgi:hypothetical protein